MSKFATSSASSLKIILVHSETVAGQIELWRHSLGVILQSTHYVYKVKMSDFNKMI